MITAQRENFVDGFLDFYPMIHGHWEELAWNKDKVPLEPCWEIYVSRETQGELLYVTLRKDGELIGYFLAFIAPGLHYRTCLTATMDIFYVHPEHRGGTAALRLFRQVLREMRDLKVQRAIMGSKLHKDSGRLFKALGFEPVETYYHKWLGD